jgi:hypothetical protein
MKNKLRSTILISLGLVLLATLVFIDTVFYHTPKFLYLFRHERELIVILAYLCLVSLGHTLFQKLHLTGEQTLFFIPGSIFIAFFMLLIPQLVFRKYLVLWGQNPLLAEYPLVWNLMSALLTFLMMLLIIMLLSALQRFHQTQANTFHSAIPKVILALILLTAFIFSLNGDRFESQLYFYQELAGNWLLLVISGVLILLTSMVAFHQPWLRQLKIEGKIIALLLHLMGILLGLYLLHSQLLVPVLVFSNCIRFFIFMCLNLTLLFMMFSLGNLLVGIIYPLSIRIKRRQS